MPKISKELALLVAKRVLVEGSKGVAYGAALLAVQTMFKGDLKSLTKEDLIRGKITPKVGE